MQTPSNCYYLLFNFHILVCISKNKHNRIYRKFFCSMNPRYFQSVIECNHFILAFLLNFYRMGIFIMAYYHSIIYILYDDYGIQTRAFCFKGYNFRCKHYISLLIEYYSPPPTSDKIFYRDNKIKFIYSSRLLIEKNIFIKFYRLISRIT